jgi:hypothetical protein
MRSEEGKEKRHGHLRLRFHRNMFPFVPDRRELWIDKFVLLFEAREREDKDCAETGQCPCPEPKKRGTSEVTFAVRTEHGENGKRDDEHDRVVASCETSAEWPELFHGVFDARLGPLGRGECREEVTFGFPAESGEVSRIYAFCHYSLVR